MLLSLLPFVRARLDRHDQLRDDRQDLSSKIDSTSKPTLLPQTTGTQFQAAQVELVTD